MESRPCDESGISVLEMMVAIAVVAVLVGFGYPMLTGASDQADDRATQATLRNGLTAARIVATDDGTYDRLDVGSLSAAEPALGFVAEATPSTGPDVVSVRPWQAVPGGTFTGMTMAGLSNAGDCFYLRDDLRTGSTEFGVRPANIAGACTALNRDDITWGSWLDA